MSPRNEPSPATIERFRQLERLREEHYRKGDQCRASVNEAAEFKAEKDPTAMRIDGQNRAERRRQARLERRR